jgi:hypothetical protein
MRSFVVALAIVATPGSAFALAQAKHQEISRDACIAAGLTEEFCERVGSEAYDVDSYEWSTPEAHAQAADSGDNATTCNAVDATLERERWLASDIRASLAQLAAAPSSDLATHVATQLGRALHTLQDNCAHHGQPNIQHAWASLTDACTGSTTSPDLQPDAIECAETETTYAMAAFVDAMNAAGATPDQLDAAHDGWTHWPARADVCEYLDSAAAWDGVDRRWDNEVVTPLLRQQFAHAVGVDDTALFDPCNITVAVRAPLEVVDTSSPPDECAKIRLYCAFTGKADAPAEPPPWDVAAAPAHSGCSTGGGASGALFAVLALVAARRPRARAKRS